MLVGKYLNRAPSASMSSVLDGFAAAGLRFEDIDMCSARICISTIADGTRCCATAAGSGKMVITYQTYIVRTPRHTVLIDTCTRREQRLSARHLAGTRDLSEKLSPRPRGLQATERAACPGPS